MVHSWLKNTITIPRVGIRRIDPSRLYALFSNLSKLTTSTFTQANCHPKTKRSDWGWQRIFIIRRSHSCNFDPRFPRNFEGYRRGEEAVQLPTETSTVAECIWEY